MWRNKIIGLLLLLAGLLVQPEQAHAVLCGTSSGSGSCFWIPAGGAANWNVGTNWSDTSGGASCSATCTAGPTTGDSATFDASSGANQSTINAAFSLSTFNAGSSSALTLVQNANTLTITGNTFTMGANITYAPIASSRIILFTSTSLTTAITTAGKTYGAITLNGSGGTFQLQDDIALRSDGLITLTNGTFDANGKNVTAGGFSSNNANTRTVTMGTGAWTMIGTTVTIWDTAAGTLNCNCNSGTLNFTQARTTGLAFATFGKSFGTVNITQSSPAYSQLVISGGPTIATLNFTNSQRIGFSSGTTTTITNAFTWAGTSSQSMMIESTSVSAAVATIVATGGGTCTWCTIGGLTFTTGTVNAPSSFNEGSNSGVTITAPFGGGGKIIGGWLFDNDNVPKFINKAA